ncbi:MAG: caspase family protein [Bacteroidia bacterium]|nr:caspase family protein [Bacteroidia bacterium]
MKQALIIGIDNYPNQPLNGSVNDATEVAKILNYNGDGSVNFDIKLVLNVGTRSELRGMIRNLFNSDADVVLLYFSGHGYIDDSLGYLVTPDGEPNDPGVSMDDILNYANRSPVKNRIIILDCCNAGNFGMPSNMAGTTQLKKGLTVLTSSREKEPSVERDGHGEFTNLLLGGLRGEAADVKGDITPGSIYSYIDMAIGNWGQRPVFRANVNRFMALRKIKPMIDSETLKRALNYFPDYTSELQLDPSFEWTNTEHANPSNVGVFKDLQKLNKLALVVSKNAEPNDMYWAAMQSKSCVLTMLGQYYWKLANENRF